MTKQVKTLADLWLPGVELKEFKPCAFIHTAMDMLVYLEKDCSVTSAPIRGTNICLLYDNGDPTKVVGVEILGISSVADFLPQEKPKSTE